MTDLQPYRECPTAPSWGLTCPSGGPTVAPCNGVSGGVRGHDFRNPEIRFENWPVGWRLGDPHGSRAPSAHPQLHCHHPGGSDPLEKYKYCPTSLNAALKAFLRGECPQRSRAYAELSCHILGLHLMQKNESSLHQRMPLVIYLFISHAPSCRATEEVAEIEYCGRPMPAWMTKRRARYTETCLCRG